MEGMIGFFLSGIKTDASHTERLHWARRRSQCTTVLRLRRIKTSSLSRSTTERTCLVSQRHRIFPPRPTILVSSIKSSRSLGCKIISRSSGETKVRSRSWYVFHREIRMPSYEADGCAYRANLRGPCPSHLPSPAGTRPSSHHSVRPFYFPEKRFLRHPNLISKLSTHSQRQWDVRNHQAHSAWSASEMSLPPRYTTSRLKIPLSFFLRKSTSKCLLYPARGRSSRSFMCSVA